MDETESRWTKVAAEMLKGRRIVDVGYMSAKDAKRLGWSDRPVVLHLDDGNIVFPSMDDEGNNGGALFTNDKKTDVLPVLSVR